MSGSGVETMQVSDFRSDLTLANKLARAVWGVTWLLLFRCTPRIAFSWRRTVLRAFGAKVGKRVRVYNTAEIFLPSNLAISDDVVIGPRVDLYCVAKITIEENVIISQRAEICTGTHDYRQPRMPLIAKSVVVKSGAWICSGAFIGPGVTIENSAIVGARAVVFKDVRAGDIVVGNPASVVKNRFSRED